MLEYKFYKAINWTSVHILHDGKMLCLETLPLSGYELCATVDSKHAAIQKAANLQISETDVCGRCVEHLYSYKHKH